MALFQYLLQDVLSRNVLGQINFVNVTFNDPIGQAGTFSGTYQLEVTGDPDTDIAISSFAASVICPDQTLIHCIWPATNKIIATYLVNSYQWDSSQNAISVSGTQLQSWLSQVYPVNIVTPLVFTNVDQLFIAQSMITSLTTLGPGQGVPSIIAGSATSGIKASLTITDIFSSDISSIITTVANNYQGFDWEIVADWSPTDGLPQLYFRTYFPEKGLQKGSTDLPLAFYATPDSSNLTGYWPVTMDASNRFNYIYATASTSSGQNYNTIWQDGRIARNRLITPQQQAGGPNFGEGNQFTPLLRMSSQSVSVSDFSGAMLGGLVANQGNSWSQSDGPQVITHHPLQPDLSTYNVGDRCRITLVDPFVNIDMYGVRIVDRAITDETPGTVGSVSVTLDLTDTTNPADSI